MAATPSAEQRAVIEHPPGFHARVLAGPGTGKSTTVLQLAEKLIDGGKAVKVITFTRAATAELAEKAKSSKAKVPEPTTVHGFALSILTRNPGASGLPEPLRIPDKWETTELIYDDLAKRLRKDGFKITKKKIRALEQWLASAWESLDPSRSVHTEIDPKLRTRYLSLWQAHRRVFGYSLFAEMPYYAKNLIEDRTDARLERIDVLVVDEFQDLNRCEIALLEALSARGIRIVGVGDDDQSIYSFRIAHPIGIQEFGDTFERAKDYPLSISFRCGRRILDAASMLIETMPGRPSRPTLAEGPGNPEGSFEYLRFEDNTAECYGVARLAKHLITTSVEASDIAVLVRSDYEHRWSKPIREALADVGVPANDVEAALDPLYEDPSRHLLAIARLAKDRADDLAWWTILWLTPRISEEFITLLTDDCIKRNMRFAAGVLSLESDSLTGATAISLKTATERVKAVLRELDGVDIKKVPASSDGWAEWLLQTADRLAIQVSDAFKRLAKQVGKITPHDEGLTHYLNELEPVAKDLALQTPGVAIMTMARSKGLTFRAAFVMGVEETVIPFPKARDENEERRLLYVAMTRAREFLYLTMARKRYGATARSGGGMLTDRQRCPFFAPLGITPAPGHDYLRSKGIT